MNTLAHEWGRAEVIVESSRVGSGTMLMETFEVTDNRRIVHRRIAWWSPLVARFSSLVAVVKVRVDYPLVLMRQTAGVNANIHDIGARPASKVQVDNEVGRPKSRCQNWLISLPIIAFGHCSIEISEIDQQAWTVCPSTQSLSAFSSVKNFSFIC